MQVDGSASSDRNEPNSGNAEVFSPSSVSEKIPANTSRFAFELIGSSEELRVVEFQGKESISQPFEFRIIVASRNDLLAAEEFMGKPGLLTFVAHEHNELLHGEIVQFEQYSEQGDFLLYQLLLVPQFWYLKKRHNHRIFQQLSVPDIVKQVFNDAGISSEYYEFRLSEPCSIRNYCVQYDESEFEFLSRLMAEEGLHYHFEHQLKRHIMIIGDQNSAFPMVHGETNIGYHPADGLNEDREVIQSFQYCLQTCHGQASLRDYNFKKPHDKLDNQRVNQQQVQYDTSLEDYHYPGDYQENSAGIKKAQLKLQQHQTYREKSILKSNCQRLRAGSRFELSGNSGGQYNQQYLLTEVLHVARQPQSLDEYGAGNSGHYSNESHCIPDKTPFKNAVNHMKPLIAGYHSSVITGPSGEEIYTNEHAQSKVQFPWDREGQLNETSSCWLRSAQGWAGKRWGSLILLRMGQEAKISYLHGDPDRPIITGQLYHELNRPPYALPKHKTRASFKTSSTLGGKGFNEIRIEDKKNHEQLFFHAEKDLDIRVKNDRRDAVKHDRHLIVDKNRYEHIKANSHHTIDNNQNEKIAQQLSTSVGQIQHSKVGQSVLTEVSQAIHLKAGQKIVLEAGVELTIKAGGGFIKIDPSGITAQGAKIDLNGGTGAGPATKANPQKPSIAAEADQDKSGQNFKAIPPQTARQTETIDFKGEISRLLQAGNDNEQAICIPCQLTAQVSQQAAETVVDKITNTSPRSSLAPLPLEPLDTNETQKTKWLELKHELSFVDDHGQIIPAKDTAYRLTLPDGSQQNGRLDNDGFARHENIPAGVYEVEYEPDIDAEVEATQKDIQQVLDGIILAEQKEYSDIEKQLKEARLFGLNFPGSNALAQVETYKSAMRTGVWNGIKGLAGFAWELIKGVGSVMYEFALRTNPITAPNKFKEDLQTLKSAHKELQQFADDDLETYAVLISDEKTHDMFVKFSEDYIKAQHSLEYAETGGQVAFDILLTIFTMGAGAVASVRHIEKLKRLKPLLGQLMELLKRRRLKKKQNGPYNSEIKTTIPLRNPHKGLHNREDLTPVFKTSAESFKTTRKLDMHNLSEVDEIVEEALLKQGWDGKKIKQILKSGSHFAEVSYKPGDKLYGFNTIGRARNLDNSAYLLDEASFMDVQVKYFKQGHWDREGIKDHLALPCFNEASNIDVIEITKSTTAIQSTVGKATELLKYNGEKGYTTGTMGKIMGGGGTQTTIDTSALKLLSGN